MPDTSPFILDRDGPIAWFTLNRPERRNALSPDLDEQLREAFEGVAQNSDVRAVILTGNGPSFCSGADLRAFDTAPTPDQVRQHLEHRFIPLLESMVACPKPIIAAVNGPAAGAGCALMLACDMRIMTDAASLAINFSEIGFVPDMGLSWFLVREIGYARTFELATLGKTIDAAECLNLGLINAITDPGNLRNEASELANKLAERAASTTTLTKQVLQFAANNPMRETLDFEAEQQQRAAATEAHREGLRAFAEKRTPDFTDL